MATWRMSIFLSSTNYSRATGRRWKSTIRRIEKILIANRGEIACRVMKTAQRLGVKTVAVYSEADENALHVAMADEAYLIGPPSASESYLRGDKILDVAKKAGCHAIHPGYGFLSENVEFAQSCEKSGVIFIGPPATAIRDMGIKSTSKSIMSAANVPIIPGYHGSDQSPSLLLDHARRLGFPLMVKAVRGGGGKGMRVAVDEREFPAALESARVEAERAFGNGEVLLERHVSEPRHVEVQVMADTYGDAVYLWERDCSVQRRCQKIIEEAPAPGLSEELRNKLGTAAVRAAKAVGYVGAGTVEFILDKNTHDFFFMEMNTRLQVEHPITEMITGTDLVEWQIKIASGEKLPLKQDEIKRNGHAFEARIYAEDPQGGFLPGAGPLLHLSTPLPGPDVRIETGVREGDEVSVHYDPMIAKLVVWGNDRLEALRKLRSKLLDYNIAGLETNVNFLLDLTKHEEFIAGNVHTNFIRDNYDTLFPEKLPGKKQLIQAGLFTLLYDERVDIEEAKKNNDQFNPFLVESSFRINHERVRSITVQHNGNAYVMHLKIMGNNEYEIRIDNDANWIKTRGSLEFVGNKVILHCVINGDKEKVNVYKNNDFIAIFGRDGKIQFDLPKPKYLSQTEGESVDKYLDKAVSPMPGILDKVLVKPGDVVKKGDSLFVIIAMKMEYVVKAVRDAAIDGVLFTAGDSVQKDAVVVKFKTEDANN